MTRETEMQAMKGGEEVEIVEEEDVQAYYFGVVCNCLWLSGPLYSVL